MKPKLKERSGMAEFIVHSVSFIHLKYFSNVHIKEKRVHVSVLSLQMTFDNHLDQPTYILTNQFVVREN